jgi:hypothetical protein
MFSDLSPKHRHLIEMPGLLRPDHDQENDRHAKCQRQDIVRGVWSGDNAKEEHQMHAIWAIASKARPAATPDVPGTDALATQEDMVVKTGASSRPIV